MVLYLPTHPGHLLAGEPQTKPQTPNPIEHVNSSGHLLAGEPQTKPQTLNHIEHAYSSGHVLAGDPLWIAIIIIIGITACITAVCLIATLCYRLSIRRRSGTAKISQKVWITSSICILRTDDFKHVTCRNSDT